ncbi:hypothetical protein CISG_09753 [Coccidioides immitis RMSCC 3703]|uniref:Uncharacterized protein n=1 Tax=Coccidioides immitis RMSCC 3703 TaxID=454286 RepID=A0A0J8QJQ6_COCIT|nr:hypothetical protein CISG_09753 [Coccidioides immitis RMSCC 3703]
MSNPELAVSYAALILADDGVEISLHQPPRRRRRKRKNPTRTWVSAFSTKRRPFVFFLVHNIPKGMHVLGACGQFCYDFPMGIIRGPIVG